MEPKVLDAGGDMCATMAGKRGSRPDTDGEQLRYDCFGDLEMARAETVFRHL